MNGEDRQNGERLAAVRRSSRLAQGSAALIAVLMAVLLIGCGSGAQGAAEGARDKGGAGAGAFNASAPGSCSDKWVNSAVYAVTGVAPQGKVCDIYLYNNGSWGSYDQLEGAVRTRMSECSDKWVTQALIETYGRGGYNKSTDCVINRYGGGQWSGYADLRTKVSKSTMCADPWVGQAIHFATGRSPVGTGLTSRSGSGECNIYLYGNGKWSSFSGLLSETRKTHTNLRNAGRQIDSSGNFRSTSGATIYTSDKGYIDLANSSSFANGWGQVIASGGGNVIASGGGNVIASGGGNVIASGAGN